MSLREAAQQALETLEDYRNGSQKQDSGAVITALKAALEQPEQEPFAWMSIGGSIWRNKGRDDDVPLYTRPQQRQWRDLTDEEISDGREQLPTEDLCGWSFRKGVEFAEAKLKEKNT